MALETLAAQTQVNAQAEAYSAECLRRARQALETAVYTPDLPYGTEAGQCLDIWAPRGVVPAGRLPVLVAFHGGNFTHGYKEWCAFMAPAVTAFPALLVAVEYRLSPATSYHDIIGDGLAALKLVHDRIAEFGGDPTRVWLTGHSAGAQIVSEIALRPQRLADAGLSDDAFRGVFALSGNYVRRLGSIEPDPANRIADTVPDSPVELAGAARHPFHVSWGGAEKPHVHDAGDAFLAALAAAGAATTRLVIPDQDHFAVHLGTGEPDSAWLADLRSSMTAG